MMNNIAIVGTGPTAVYTLRELVRSGDPCFITLYERADLAGVGMPYSPEVTHTSMLANIASVEIPPVTETLIAWLDRQPSAILAVYGIDPEKMNDRTFLPRVLLGGYFRDAMEQLIADGRETGFQIALRESTEVVGCCPAPEGIWLDLSTDEIVPRVLHDHVILATGHSWPEGGDAERPVARGWIPSPWSGLLDTGVPAERIGILGTSLSAIDALIAVALQHGEFTPSAEGRLDYALNPGSEGLSITLMSRNGHLPEIDFFCPLPCEPPFEMTEEAVVEATRPGSNGLLDRLFDLFVRELEETAPDAPLLQGSEPLAPENIADHYFAERSGMDPFDWAARTLAEAERNHAVRQTIAWKYAILRVHEVFDAHYGGFDPEDRARFDAGLKRVFVDNYAAVPPHSIHRLLALRRAGIVDILALGSDYQISRFGDGLRIGGDAGTQRFAAIIDSRGQTAQSAADLPFADLRAALRVPPDSDQPVPIAADLGLPLRVQTKGRVWLPSASFLLHRHPFLQGIPRCAAMGRTVAASVKRSREQAQDSLEAAL